MRVNLSELKVRVEDMSKEYQGLGGRGLSSHIVGREVPPKTDPLGPENKLIFSAGILAGTAIPNTGRTLCGSQEPVDQRHQRGERRRISRPENGKARVSGPGD